MLVLDRHIVVTGASRGIGAGLARELASRGARLTLVARTESALAAVASDTGGRPLPADLADPAHVAGLIERAESLNGPVDVLVNNAGVDVTGPLVQASSDDVEWIHRVNLIAPIELTRQVLPGMIERGTGHVVNVSSMAAAGGFPGFSLYCSTKAGLSQFTRVLRQDLKRTRIVLTAVELGPIPTDMLEKVDRYPPADRAFTRLRRIQLMPNTPVERVAKRTADAIERERQHVWLPGRAAAFPFIVGVPQWLTGLLVKGIDP